MKATLNGQRFPTARCSDCTALNCDLNHVWVRDATSCTFYLAVCLWVSLRSWGKDETGVFLGPENCALYIYYLRQLRL